MEDEFIRMLPIGIINYILTNKVEKMTSDV